MSDEKPKKVRKSSPKKTAKQSENNNDIQEQDILNVKHLINDLIQQRTQHVATQRNVQDVNTALVNTISEFLNCLKSDNFE